MKRTLCTVLTALTLATALPAIGATTEAGSTSAATTGTTTGATVGTTAGTTGTGGRGDWDNRCCHHRCDCRRSDISRCRGKRQWR